MFERKVASFDDSVLYNEIYMAFLLNSQAQGVSGKNE